MLLKDDKKKMVTIIMKKLKGSDDYSRMQSSNEAMMEAPTVDGAEMDTQDGERGAANKLVDAIHSKDSQSALEAIHALFKMYMDSKPSNSDDY